MNRAKTTVILELSLTEGHLSGRATDVEGTRQDFDGWLGLIGAIDGVVGQDAGSPIARETTEEEISRAHH